VKSDVTIARGQGSRHIALTGPRCAIGANGTARSSSRMSPGEPARRHRAQECAISDQHFDPDVRGERAACGQMLGGSCATPREAPTAGGSFADSGRRTKPWNSSPQTSKPAS